GVPWRRAWGPHKSRWLRRGARLRWVSLPPGSCRSDNRQLPHVADEPLSAVTHPEIIMVPGGFGTRALMTPNPLLDWLQTAHERSQWTTSVCTGSLLLGAAGLLKGLEATTHWAAHEQPAALGAKPTLNRGGGEGKIITAAGVSAGIDMALTLVARIAGEELAQMVQLGIEYDPQPPFHAGSPQTAPPHIVAALRERTRARLESAKA